MNETTNVQETLSDVMNNIKNLAAQNGNSHLIDDVDKTPTHDMPECTLENPPVPLNESEVQFNMSGSMLSREFFQRSIATKLNLSAINVYIFIGFNCDFKTGKITRKITIKEIALACQIRPRSVYRALGELQEKGFLDQFDQSILKGRLLLRKK